ncbi:hypothetical protein J6590_032657 [Homalodisca vitripennis]|nr:hypothetical protein J6590_032657 [Homalodisca vitripennis]
MAIVKHQSKSRNCGSSRCSRKFGQEQDPNFVKNMVQRRNIAVGEEVRYKKKLEDDSWKRGKVVNSRGNHLYEDEGGGNGAVYVTNERFMKPRIPEPAMATEARLYGSELVTQTDESSGQSILFWPSL